MAILSRCALVLVLGAVAARAAPQGALTPREYEVKAAFLCNFAEFVEWPSGTGDPLTICILGVDPFGRLLDETIKERGSQAPALAVTRLPGVDAARRCQIVFVGSSEKGALGQTLRALEGSSILTVSDISGFAARGGVIGFTVEEKHVRFEINVEAAARARLRISSRLLKLARIVNGPEG